MKHRLLITLLLICFLPALAICADNNSKPAPTAPTIAPAQRNLQSVKNFYDAVNKKDMNSALAIFNGNYTVKFVGTLDGHTIDAQMSQTVNDLKTKLGYIDYIMPDHQTHLFNTIAEGNQVFVYAVTVARKTEPFLEAAPIDKQVKIINFNIFQFDNNGKVEQITILWNEPTAIKKLAYMVL